MLLCIVQVFGYMFVEIVSEQCNRAGMLSSTYGHSFKLPYALILQILPVLHSGLIYPWGLSFRSLHFSQLPLYIVRASLPNCGFFLSHHGLIFPRPRVLDNFGIFNILVIFDTVSAILKYLYQLPVHRESGVSLLIRYYH